MLGANRIQLHKQAGFERGERNSLGRGRDRYGDNGTEKRECGRDGDSLQHKPTISLSPEACNSEPTAGRLSGTRPRRTASWSRTIT